MKNLKQKLFTLSLFALTLSSLAASNFTDKTDLSKRIKKAQTKLGINSDLGRSPAQWLNLNVWRNWGNWGNWGNWDNWRNWRNRWANNWGNFW